MVGHMSDELGKDVTGSRHWLEFPWREWGKQNHSQVLGPELNPYTLPSSFSTRLEKWSGNIL